MEPIPESARYGSVGRTFTVWFTPNLVPAAFFIGTLVTADFLKLGFVTSLLAIIIGNVIGSYFVALLSTMGPKLGLAQMAAARLPFGKSIVLPGMLNWLSTIGWDGINSVFGAIAITLLIPAVPFWLALLLIIGVQALLSIVGYEAIHTFEKWMAIVLGVMFVVLTISILGKADTSLQDGFSGADQIGAFIGYVAIVASFVLAWSLYASDYSRYLPANADTRKVFWYTLGGMALASAWLEILGLLVAGPAAGGESSDTIFGLLGGSGNIIAMLAMVAIAIGTIAVNAMNDYTGSLSLQAAGLKIPRV
jgi:NCS1 family nucleobase:cation symporter-1